MRLADETARARVVTPHERTPCLIVEAAERGCHIAAGRHHLRCLHTHDRLQLAEAVEAELLREAHDGRT